MARVKIAERPVTNTLHTIIVTPGRPGIYEAHYEGALLCSSRQPFLDAARVLLEQNMARPRDEIVMKHGTDGCPSLRARVGVAAKITVRENDDVGPLFARYVPFSAVASAAFLSKE